jgi:site-specific recombinase XerD
MHGVFTYQMDIKKEDRMIDAVSFYYAWKMFRERCVSGHANPRFRKKPMGPSGFIQASIIWKQWSSFCADRKIAWFNARETDVERYLQSIRTRRRPRVTGADGKMSSTDRIKTDSRVTIRRYWRILNDFYAFGLAEHYVQQNPAVEVKPEDGEGTQSTLLSIAEYCQSMELLPVGQGVKASRDRLALLLAARHALTTAEIVSLRLTDVSELPRVHTEAIVAAGASATVKHVPPVLYELALTGSRTTQARTIALDDTTSIAMGQWLKRRPQVSSASLLVGHHGERWTPKDVHYLFSKHLEKCQISVERRTGANTFRNSCILNWLNDKVPLHEIVRRCGLKDATFLRRLACHIRPSIAEVYGCKTAVISPISSGDRGGLENMDLSDDQPVLFKMITRSLAANVGKLSNELSAVWDGTPAHAKELSAKLRHDGPQRPEASAQ